MNQAALIASQTAQHKKRFRVTTPSGRKFKIDWNEPYPATPEAVERMALEAEKRIPAKPEPTKRPVRGDATPSPVVPFTPAAVVQPGANLAGATADVFKRRLAPKPQPVAAAPRPQLPQGPFSIGDLANAARYKAGYDAAAQQQDDMIAAEIGKAMMAYKAGANQRFAEAAQRHPLANPPRAWNQAPVPQVPPTSAADMAAAAVRQPFQGNPVSAGPKNYGPSVVAGPDLSTNLGSLLSVLRRPPTKAADWYEFADRQQKGAEESTGDFLTELGMAFAGMKDSPENSRQAEDLARRVSEMAGTKFAASAIAQPAHLLAELGVLESPDATTDQKVGAALNLLVNAIATEAGASVLGPAGKLVKDTVELPFKAVLSPVQTFKDLKGGLGRALAGDAAGVGRAVASSSDKAFYSAAELALKEAERKAISESMPPDVATRFLEPYRKAAAQGRAERLGTNLFEGLEQPDVPAPKNVAPYTQMGEGETWPPARPDQQPPRRTRASDVDPDARLGPDVAEGEAVGNAILEFANKVDGRAGILDDGRAYVHMGNGERIVFDRPNRIEVDVEAARANGDSEEDIAKAVLGPGAKGERVGIDEMVEIAGIKVPASGIVRVARWRLNNRGVRTLQHELGHEAVAQARRAVKAGVKGALAEAEIKALENVYGGEEGAMKALEIYLKTGGMPPPARAPKPGALPPKTIADKVRRFIGDVADTLENNRGMAAIKKIAEGDGFGETAGRPTLGRSYSLGKGKPQIPENLGVELAPKDVAANQRRFDRIKDDDLEVATNPRMKFEHNGRVWVVGQGKTFDDFLEEQIKNLTPSEIREFRKWYKKQLGGFTSRGYGVGDLIGDFAANQNVSTDVARANWFKVLDQTNGLGNYGGTGLAYPKLVDLAKTGALNVGNDMGPKLSDFIAGGLDARVRSFMGRDPAYGDPLVVDLHTTTDIGGKVNGVVIDKLYDHWRDGTLNGQKITNFERNRSFVFDDDGNQKFEKDGTPSLKTDSADVTLEDGQVIHIEPDFEGTPSAVEYEKIAKRGRKWRDLLNQNAAAIDDPRYARALGGEWDSGQVQALGWMNTLKRRNEPMQSPEWTWDRVSSTIPTEVAWNFGAAFKDAYPDPSVLTDQQMADITYDVVNTVARDFASRIGSALRIQSIERGRGLWEGDWNPNAIIVATGTAHTRRMLAEMMAFAGEQGGTFMMSFQRGDKHGIFVQQFVNGKRKLLDQATLEDFIKGDWLAPLIKAPTKAQINAEIKALKKAGKTPPPFDKLMAKRFKQKVEREVNAFKRSVKGATVVNDSHLIAGLSESTAGKILHRLDQYARAKGLSLNAEEINHEVAAAGHNWRSDRSGGSYLRWLEDARGTRDLGSVGDLRRAHAEALEDALQKHAPGFADPAKRQDRIDAVVAAVESQRAQTDPVTGTPLISGGAPKPATAYDLAAIAKATQKKGGNGKAKAPPIAAEGDAPRYSLGDEVALGSTAEAPDTPEFRAWFGRSQAVRDDGKPEVFYHGTPDGGFSSFSGNEGNGLTWVTKDPEFGSSFAGQPDGVDNPSVYPLFVKTERPFDPESPEGLEVIRRFAETNVDDIASEYDSGDGREAAVRQWLDDAESGGWQAVELPGFVDHIRSLGYDSLKSSEHGTTNYGVFDSAQLKSATGNTGAFDGGNPDVRYSLGDEVAPGSEQASADPGSAPKIWPNVNEFNPRDAVEIDEWGNPRWFYSVAGTDWPHERGHGLYDDAKAIYRTSEYRKFRDSTADPESMSPGFKDWFEGSVIRHPDGKPRIMYHGTPHARFSEFAKSNHGGLYFFSASPKYASKYAFAGDGIGATPGIYPVYLSAKNPFDYRVDGRRMAEKFIAEGGYGDRPDADFIRGVEHGRWVDLEQPAFIDFIRKQGYDSWYSGEGGVDNYAVFDSRQVKSAFGNNGDYDPTNPDIRYSLGDEPGYRVNNDPYERGPSRNDPTIMDMPGINNLAPSLRQDVEKEIRSRRAMMSTTVSVDEYRQALGDEFDASAEGVARLAKRQNLSPRETVFLLEAVHALDIKRGELKAKVDDLANTLGEQHPDTIQAMRDLDSVRAAWLAAVTPATKGASEIGRALRMMQEAGSSHIDFRGEYRDIVQARGGKELTDEQKLALQDALDRVQEAIRNAMRRHSEVGRQEEAALQSLEELTKKYNRAQGAARRNEIRSDIAQRTLDDLKRQIEGARKALEQLQQAGRGAAENLTGRIPANLWDDPRLQAAIADYIQHRGSLTQMGWLDTILEMRKLGLLTNVRTVLRNAFSNAVQMARLEGLRPADALVDAALNLRYKTGRTIEGTPFGGRQAGRIAKRAIKRTGKDFASIWKYGATQEDLARFDSGGRQSPSKIADQYLMLLRKGQAVQDKPWYNAAYERSLYEQARLAKRSDPTVDIETLVNNPTDAMAAQAVADAELATFSTDNKATDFVNRAARSNDGAKVAIDAVLPFRKVPLNIAADVATSNPVMVLANLWKYDKKIRSAIDAGMIDVARQHQKRLARLVTNGAAGSALLLLGYELARQGKMFGASPAQPGTRDARDAAGIRPLSINVGGTMYSAAGLHPFLNIMGLGATYYERYASDEDAADKAANRAAVAGMADPADEDSTALDAIVDTVTAMVGDQPWFLGIRQVADLTKPGNGWQRYAGQLAGSMVPTAVSDARQLLKPDPVQRDPQSIPQVVQSRLGMTDNLPYKVDALGEVQPRKSGIGIADIFNTGPAPRPGTVENEIVRTRTPITKAKAKAELGEQNPPVDRRIDTGRAVKGAMRDLLSDDRPVAAAQRAVADKPTGALATELARAGYKPGEPYSAQNDRVKRILLRIVGSKARRDATERFDRRMVEGR